MRYLSKDVQKAVGYRDLDLRRGLENSWFPPEEPESGASAGEVKDQVAGRNSAGRPQSGTADLYIFGIGEQSFS